MQKKAVYQKMRHNGQEIFEIILIYNIFELISITLNYHNPIP